MPVSLTQPHPLHSTSASPAGGSVDWEQMGREHALLIARGVIDDAVLADFPDRIEALVDSGVRYVVVDLSQVSSCSTGLVAALAQACRVLLHRHGWLRSVATAACVTVALEQAEATDLLAVYQAGVSTPGS